jgi:hypothetical protein
MIEIASVTTPGLCTVLVIFSSTFKAVSTLQYHYKIAFHDNQ